MILNAYFDSQWHNAEAAEEVASLIPELIAALKHENPSPIFIEAGTDALLCFANERYNHKYRLTKDVKGHLQVAVNKATGYGALMWYWGVSDPVWVSDSPQPPDFDPRVVSDPGYPLFHDPASTLPIKQFLEVLSEFCYSGTGERPKSIRWVRSDICGRRQDQPNPDDAFKMTFTLEPGEQS